MLFDPGVSVCFLVNCLRRERLSPCLPLPVSLLRGRRENRKQARDFFERPSRRRGWECSAGTHWSTLLRMSGSASPRASECAKAVMSPAWDILRGFSVLIRSLHDSVLVPDMSVWALSACCFRPFFFLWNFDDSIGEIKCVFRDRRSRKIICFFPFPASYDYFPWFVEHCSIRGCCRLMAKRGIGRFILGLYPVGDCCCW